AIAFAEAGADLLITELNADGLQDTAGQIQKLGRSAIAMPGDVTDIAHIRSLYARIDREFGRIDVAMNVAGPGQLAKPDTISLELMERIVYGLVVHRLAHW